MTVLVLDIGSSSVRALLFDDQARLIPGALVSMSHQIVTDPPGAATLDMLAVQANVEACLDAILRHPSAANITVVGVDTLVGNVLGVDAAGLPVTPIYAYSDTRSADDVSILRARVNAAAKHQDTGCLLHTAYLPARLHWLRRTAPRLTDAVAQWLDVGAYLYRQWFGDTRTSYSVASWSGLLNRSALDWDDEWRHVLELDRASLAPLDDYTATRAGLRAPYAERWRALRDVPFCLAMGDGAAANVGAGCVSRSRIALTVGTTAALRTITAATLPPVPPGLWSYRVDAGLHLIGGATSEGGNIYRWAQENLILGTPAAVEAALAARIPDSHGLTVLPLLAGERSPGWAADATGAVVGLRLSTTPLDILQASLEAVCHRLALIAEQLYAVTGSDVAFTASGGALAASPAWTQMVANALNKPLEITAETELTARGTAILALRAVGACTLTEYPPTMIGTVTPKADHAAIFQRARQRQTALYQQLIAERPTLAANQP